MKKTIALLLAVLTVLLLTVPALALTWYELFTRWEQDGYPEDVTGVFYNTETQCLAILLTDNTEARQKAIRESLTDGDTLTFFASSSSYEEPERKNSSDSTFWFLLASVYFAITVSFST